MVEPKDKCIVCEKPLFLETNRVGRCPKCETTLFCYQCNEKRRTEKTDFTCPVCGFHPDSSK